MANAIFEPIPTFLDFDIGRSARQIPVQSPPSRRKLFLRGQPEQDMTLGVNPTSRSERAVKCATDFDDESPVLVLAYLLRGEPAAAEGQAIIGIRTVAAFPDGVTCEVFTPPASTEAQRFLDTVRRNISEDSADLIREEGIPPTQPGVDACLAIASTLSDIVAMKPTLKYAAFVEESGAISLVIQSEHPGRRVNFRVSPDGRQIAVVAVTSQGYTSTNPVRIDDTETLRGWVEWLRKRD